MMDIFLLQLAYRHFEMQFYSNYFTYYNSYVLTLLDKVFLNIFAQRMQLASVYKGEAEKILLVKKVEAEVEAKYSLDYCFGLWFFLSR